MPPRPSSRSCCPITPERSSPMRASRRPDGGPGLLWIPAAIATGLCIVFGVPLAWVLASSDTWNPVPRRLLRVLVIVPLVLPPVVGGIALLLFLGRQGLVGRWLYEWFGITLPFSTAAVVI